MATTAAQLVQQARTSIRELPPADVEAHLLGDAAVLVDLREHAEIVEHGSIAGAVHVPRGVLEFWADPQSPAYRSELDPARRTIVFCAAGSRSALAARSLQELGYGDVAHLTGGIAAWKEAGLPVVGLEPWHRTA